MNYPAFNTSLQTSSSRNSVLHSLFNSTSDLFIHHIHCYHITCDSRPNTWMKSKILSCVQTSTWQQQLYHIAHFLPLSLHTSSNRFASQQLSPCSAIAKHPFSGPQPLIVIQWTMPATLPANQWQSRQTSGSTDEKASFQATCSIQCSLQKEYISLDYISEGSNQSATHQERSSNV